MITLAKCLALTSFFCIAFVAQAAAPQGVPVTIAGMRYAANGFPVGFEGVSFDQTENEFGRQFRASECVHFGGGEVRCSATFKGTGGTGQIAAFFRYGKMYSMVELVRAGCDAQSAEFSKRMVADDRENTAFMAAFFLPSGIRQLSHNAMISAASAGDVLHAMTACERNDSGMVLLTRESLIDARKAGHKRVIRSY